MHSFYVVFMALNAKEEIKFITTPIVGPTLPENNSKDIVELCTMLSAMDDEFRYIDIVAVVLGNGEIYWEDKDEMVTKGHYVSEEEQDLLRQAFSANRESSPRSL